MNLELTTINQKPGCNAPANFKAMQSKNWNDSLKKLPEIGDRILVKMLLNDTVYFAVYTADDEFDVHRPEIHVKNHRKQWFKFSHRSVTKWRYF